MIKTITTTIKTSKNSGWIDLVAKVVLGKSVEEKRGRERNNSREKTFSEYSTYRAQPNRVQ